MKYLILLLTLVSGLFSQPCQSVDCESQIYNEILQSNGTQPITGSATVMRDTLVAGECHLTGIVISGKNITTIPASVGRLYYLRLLMIKNSKVVNVPAELSNLVLKTNNWTLGQKYPQGLSLDSNLITTLPQSFTSWTKLDRIYVRGNKLCNAPSDLVTWLDSTSTVGWRSTQNCADRLETPKTPTFSVSYSPNPFAGSTTLTYTLPRAAHVSILIYRASGEFVKVQSGYFDAGTYKVPFVGQSSGVYFSRVVVSGTGSQVFTQKLLMVK